MILIADANYLCYAALHSATGELDNGVTFGALHMLLKEVMSSEADRVIIATEGGKIEHSVRRALGTEAAMRYKANRSKRTASVRKEYKEEPGVGDEFDEFEAPGASTSESAVDALEALSADFWKQHRLFLGICEQCGFAVASAPGYEADDVIAYYVEQNQDHEIYIISNDSDLYQLFGVARDVVMVRPTAKKQEDRYFGMSAFIDKYKIWPHQWAVVKAMMGDSSDEITGIEGFGVKTAAKYQRGGASVSEEHVVKKHAQLINDNYELIRLPFKGVENSIQSTGDGKPRMVKQTFIDAGMPSLAKLLDKKGSV